MALPKFKKDMRIVSVLSDRPNAASNEHLDGLQLKQKFDEGGEALKEYINETLIPFLAGSEAAASLGINTISGISEAANIQQALEALKFAIDNTTAGAIPDGSLGGEKLLPGTITNREMAREAIGKENVKKKVLGAEEIADDGIEGYNLADKIIANRHLGLLAVEDGNVADKTLSGGKIKDGTLTANLYAKNSVQEPTIAPNAVTRAKLGQDALYSPIQAVSGDYTLSNINIGETFRSGSHNAAYNIIITEKASTAWPMYADFAVFRYGKENGGEVTVTFAPGLNVCAQGWEGYMSGGITIRLPLSYQTVAFKKVTSLNMWYVIGEVEVVA